MIRTYRNFVFVNSRLQLSVTLKVQNTMDCDTRTSSYWFTWLGERNWELGIVTVKLGFKPYLIRNQSPVTKLPLQLCCNAAETTISGVSQLYIAVTHATLDSRFHTETKTRQYASLLHKSLLPFTICQGQDCPILSSYWLGRSWLE